MDFGDVHSRDGSILYLLHLSEDIWPQNDLLLMTFTLIT